MSTLEEAAASLESGNLVVIPTDTVYGVAAHLAHPEAIQAIFTAKGRPPDKPIPILAADIGQLAAVAEFDERARALATRFWPGPLTLILVRAPGFDVDLGGDELRTVGVRVPKEPRALSLLRVTGPLAVTSANRSGMREATTISEAMDALACRRRSSFSLASGACCGRERSRRRLWLRCSTNRYPNISP